MKNKKQKNQTLQIVVVVVILVALFTLLGLSLAKLFDINGNSIPNVLDKIEYC